MRDIVARLGDRIGAVHSHYISDDMQLLIDAKAEIERLRSPDPIREALEELANARAAFDRSLQTGTEKQTIRTEKRLFQAWDTARAALSKHRDHPPAHRSDKT